MLEPTGGTKMHLRSRLSIKLTLLLLLIFILTGSSLACFAQSDSHSSSAPGELVPATTSDEMSDRSDALKNSKDRDFILRRFRTMYVDAREANYFGSDLMKSALARNDDFEALNIRIVDDPRVADVVLVVSYTFAWDYPFELKHQNTTMVLLAGQGEGPFSGPLGAASVADEFVKLAKRYRTPAEKKK
jgi:hypothetical protein